MPEIPENPMFNMKPNSLIWGARYDKVMEAFGGKGFFVEDPKHNPRRPRRGDEPPRPGAGQHRAQPRLSQKAAAVPLAQLIGLRDQHSRVLKPAHRAEPRCAGVCFEPDSIILRIFV